MKLMHTLRRSLTAIMLASLATSAVAQKFRRYAADAGRKFVLG